MTNIVLICVLLRFVSSAASSLGPACGTKIQVCCT